LISVASSVDPGILTERAPDLGQALGGGSHACMIGAEHLQQARVGIFQLRARFHAATRARKAKPFVAHEDRGHGVILTDGGAGGLEQACELRTRRLQATSIHQQHG